MKSHSSCFVAHNMNNSLNFVSEHFLNLSIKKCYKLALYQLIAVSNLSVRINYISNLKAILTIHCFRNNLQIRLYQWSCLFCTEHRFSQSYSRVITTVGAL